MDKGNMIRKQRGTGLLQLSKKKNYTCRSGVQIRRISDRKKRIILSTVLSKSKGIGSYCIKPAFSAKLIEEVLGSKSGNQNDILFKCPPKGKPAFKIQD